MSDLNGFNNGKLGQSNRSSIKRASSVGVVDKLKKRSFGQGKAADPKSPQRCDLADNNEENLLSGIEQLRIGKVKSYSGSPAKKFQINSYSPPPLRGRRFRSPSSQEKIIEQDQQKGTTAEKQGTKYAAKDLIDEAKEADEKEDSDEILKGTM